MGQYWKPINLNTFEWLYSHDYGNGLKLMEHSWIGNNFIGTIMKLLTKGNKWYKGKIVWGGDYSEKVYKDNNLYDFCSDKDDKEGIKLFKKIKPNDCLTEEEQTKAIIVNYTKKEYVKIGDLKPRIKNPLPLLTALGNGGGGGDYIGSDMDFVGRWAFDEIGVEFDEKELKDFIKINPNFEEGEEEGRSLENEIVAYEKIREWLKSEEMLKPLIIAGL